MREATPPGSLLDARDYWYLCLACGEITAVATWTFWQAKDDWEDEAYKWRPSLDGEGDPMCKCPACGWEHVDDDSNPGIYDGTLAEMEWQRDEIVDDYEAVWTVAH